MKERAKNYTTISLILMILSTILLSPSFAADIKTNKESSNPLKIILEVSHNGGFMPQYITRSRVPLLRLYESKEILVTQEKDSLILIKSNKLTDKQISKIKKDFAPLTKITDWGSPGISDASTTNVTLYLDKEKYSINIYALGMDYGLTKSQKTNREKIRKVISSVEKLSGNTNYKPKYYQAYKGYGVISEASGLGIANPASVLCASQGYTSTSEEGPKGTTTLCNLPSGPIDEWENFRNVQSHYPQLPTIISRNRDCIYFKANNEINKLPQLQSFLEPSGALLPYALRAILPNEKPCLTTP